MNLWRRTLCSASLGLTLTLAAAPARAEADAATLAQASNFFDAGAQAYKAGQYQVAAEAFLKAHELAPNPALLFSAAQAYRRQYLTEPSPGTLRRSISLYREYLRADPTAKRREDALDALEALVPLETRVGGVRGSALVDAGDKGPDGDTESPAPVVVNEPGRGTRFLISTPADGDEAAVDDGPFKPAPLVARVQPGAHQVRVRAPGYDEEQFSLQAVNGELMPRHVILRPKPAKLRVTGTSGAYVTVDGQVLATVPTSAPLLLAPGAHIVTVTLSGHKPFRKLVELERDASMELVADLPMTRQRIAAWSVLSAGAASAVASGVLMGMSLARQSEASSLSDKQQSTPLLPSELTLYNNAVGARNNLAQAAAITGGAAAVLLSVGVGLFALDRPEAVPLDDTSPKAPVKPTPRADFEIGLMSMGMRVVF